MVLMAWVLPPLVLPSRAGHADLLAVLSWLVWTALPLGLWAGRAGAGAGAFLGAAAAWAAAGVASALLGPARQLEPDGVRALCGVAVALGPLALGLGLGAAWPRAAALAAYVALAVALVATGLPVGLGLRTDQQGGQELAARAPDTASRLLDLSPVTIAAESAGIDWMRHPAVYGPAGTDWFSGRRRPYSGTSGAVALLLGIAAAALLRRMTRDVRARDHAVPSDATP